MPSVFPRLFKRETPAGDWGGVFERVAADLRREFRIE
jgi:hypothetical protein